MILAGTAFLIGLASTAQADLIASGPAHGGTTQTAAVCYIFNAGSGGLTVSSIQIIAEPSSAAGGDEQSPAHGVRLGRHLPHRLQHLDRQRRRVQGERLAEGQRPGHAGDQELLDPELHQRAGHKPGPIPRVRPAEGTTVVAAIAEPARSLTPPNLVNYPGVRRETGGR